MRVVLTKTVGLVAGAILALGAVGVVAPSVGTGHADHLIVADHQGPATVTP
ncbi:MULTISPECIES: hypothetical protein [Streptomyces]|uniref:hypothetical protein n=1 Tax=Streptomyces TaxID=1883 RepID=UPI001C2F1975|nr:hypothetical protein [Streptomyces sp. GbtcB7]